jgi:peptidoglycan/LPS O-acetylase OafA/YrhL
MTDALSKQSDYRPDIDGLRAIAVLSVVLFHFFPSVVQGGFIGVDIFFVISGFLISKHIWEELTGGKFSIKTFYARRVRRIFPALSVVLLACLLMGWIILTPSEYEQLGKHVTGGVLFVSNIVLWKEAGYFDNASDTKPLLHLWSLGIEEQFYIVWPLLLALFWRYTRHIGSAVLCVMGVSLLYSVVVIQQDAVKDFYSPFTRFWELALGAGLAYVIAHKTPPLLVVRSMVSWIALFLILISVVTFQKDSAFPGYLALLPTLGAAGLIYAGQSAVMNRRLLSHPVMVWFGLISYPLYLWHWPLLSFARIMESGMPTVEIRGVLVVVSIVLGWLTYQFLERPVRSRPRSKQLIPMLCLTMFVLGAVGLTVKKMDGIKSRQFSMLNADPETLKLGADRGLLLHQCGINADQRALFQYCLSSSAQASQYALLGDSKGEALFYGLVRESKPEMTWTMIGSVSPPQGGTNSSENHSNDKQSIKNQLAYRAIAQNPTTKLVVLAVAMRSLFPVDSHGFIEDKTIIPGNLEAYSRAIQALEKAGKRVIFVIDNPTFPDPTSCISGGATSNPFLNQFLQRKENPNCKVSYTDHLGGTQAYRHFISELQKLNPGLVVYDSTPLLCDIPNNQCAIIQKGKFLYSYGDHISDYANSIIARDMVPVIRKLVQ